MPFLTSLLSGGIVGLIGKAINSVITYKMKKDEFKHTETMAEIEIKGMAAEAEARSKLMERQFQGMTDVEEAKAFTESLKIPMKLDEYNYKIVSKLMEIEGKWTVVTIPISIFLIALMTIIEAIRVIMRPAITSFYTIITAYIGYQYFEILKMQKNVILNPANTALVTEMVSTIINAIIFITVTCTIWWFGERADKRMMDRFHKNSS